MHGIEDATKTFPLLPRKEVKVRVWFELAAGRRTRNLNGRIKDRGEEKGRDSENRIDDENSNDDRKGNVHQISKLGDNQELEDLPG